MPDIIGPRLREEGDCGNPPRPAGRRRQSSRVTRSKSSRSHDDRTRVRKQPFEGAHLVSAELIARQILPLHTQCLEPERRSPCGEPFDRGRKSTERDVRDGDREPLHERQHCLQGIDGRLVPTMFRSYGFV